MPFDTAEAVMWQLAQYFTGRVGYKRGVKSEGLAMTPPVIDCSGWTGLLLTRAMRAENKLSGRKVFSVSDVDALQSWSDRIIQELESRTAFILEGAQINARTLPRCATIGLKIGAPDWASNHPRLRGINHIVQVVRRYGDDAAFVSESFGGLVSPGICLTPLEEWLVQAQPRLDAGEMWAVDPFLLASNQEADRIKA